jgi:hypothetical protein
MSKDISKLRVTKMPGSYFAVNQDKIFPIENEYGIPIMAKVSVGDLDLSMPFLKYREKDRNGICHFFLDDYRFESVWNHPVKALRAVLTYKGAVSPDFSLYTDWPPALNIWNVYRNRWCGRLWNEYGQIVVPTVGWTTEESYKFCFLGIQSKSIVAMAYFKGSDFDSDKYFLKGYEELIKQIDPEKVLMYCNNMAVDIKDDRIIIKETFWQRRSKFIKS